MKPLLTRKFIAIRKDHFNNLIKISATVVLGSSVIRVFRPHSKAKLEKALSGIHIDYLQKVRSQRQFDAWYYRVLDRLSKVLKRTNPQRLNSRIYPGYKWGHSAKVLNLFLREIVENRRYFKDATVNRIRNYLYVPIDSKVIKAIVNTNTNIGVRKIKEIDSKKKFDEIQKVLRISANQAHCPMIWFDDVWGIE
jgi:hypothetical protein